MRIITNAAKLLLLIFAISASNAYGQDGRLNIDHLDRLAGAATELIDVTVDQNLLQLASKFLRPERSADEALIKEIVNDLKGVYVKRLVFGREGEFSDSDIDSVRSQLGTPGWMKIVNVRSRKKNVRNLDVYLMSEGAVVKGLAVILIEPTAFTVVNVVGPIDLEKLSKLEGRFGIPKLDLVRGETPENQ